jgi:calcineurin-like phosphoesterase family protein
MMRGQQRVVSSFLFRYAGSCINVHGHIHARCTNDSRYVNICVEQINYTTVTTTG